MTCKYVIEEDELFPYYWLTDSKRGYPVVDLDVSFIKRLRKAEKEFFECQTILQNKYNKEM